MMIDLLEECEPMRDRPKPMNVMDLCRTLGYRFEMDWDGESLIDPPSEIDQRLITAYLVDRKEEITGVLRRRSNLAMHQFIGGPLNGETHDYCYGPIYKKDARGSYQATDLPVIKAVHVARAQWAAYRLTEDGRAYFLGLATSKPRAMRQEFTTKAT